jgi:hypothetical protein
LKHLPFERHRYLLCNASLLAEAEGPYRLHLEDDIDGCALFTLSEERLDAHNVNARVREVENALDLDMPQARWVLDQLRAIRAGDEEGRRVFPCSALADPPSRLRVQDEHGRIIVAQELTAGRSVWAMTLSVPARLSLSLVEVDWFIRELVDILRIRGYEPAAKSEEASAPRPATVGIG